MIDINLTQAMVESSKGKIVRVKNDYETYIPTQIQAKSIGEDAAVFRSDSMRKEHLKEVFEVVSGDTVRCY